MVETVNIGEDLIQATVDYIAKPGKKDYSQTAVIFPNKRMGIYLRNKLNETIGNYYIPPRLFPIEGFISALFSLNFPGYTEIDDMTASFLVYRSMIKIRDEDVMVLKPELFEQGYFQFFPWCLELMNALNEILREGCDLNRIPQSQFKKFVQLGDYFKNYKDFISLMPVVAKYYLKYLEEDNFATSSMKYWKINQLIETKSLILPDGISRYVLAGFNVLNKVEQRLFKLILSSDLTFKKFLINTEIKQISDSYSPFHLQDRTAADLGYNIEVPDNNLSWFDHSLDIEIYPTPNFEMEMMGIYRIIEKILEQEPELPLEKIGIVLPRSESLIPFVQAVCSRFDTNSVKFNISMGYPFKRTPVYQLIDSALDLRINLDSKGCLIISDFMNLLRHPYIRIMLSDYNSDDFTQLLAIIDEIVVAENMITSPYPDLKDKVLNYCKSNHLTPEFAILESIEEILLKPSTETFCNLCKYTKTILMKIKNRKKEFGYLFLDDYLTTAATALDQMVSFQKRYELELENYDISDGVGLLKYYLSKISIVLNGTPFEGIQVMGLMEYRGLKFKHLIVADVVEGILPENRKYDPILPNDIRKILNLRIYSEWEKLYEFGFFSAIMGAEKIYIFYPDYMDGQKTIRSRFIEKIFYQYKKQLDVDENSYIYYPQLKLTVSSSRPVNAVKTKPIKAMLQSPDYYFSPTSLEEYLTCPLKFYYHRILKIEQLQETLEEADALHTGNIIHRFLKEVYEQKMMGYDDLDLNDKQKLGGILENQFEQLKISYRSGIGKIRFHVMLEKLYLFLKDDFENLKNTNFKITGLEKQYKIKFPLGSDGNIDIELRGQIDRIESNQNLVNIADYKTGSHINVRSNKNLQDIIPELINLEVTQYQEELSRFKTMYPEFQLMCYMMMYKNYHKLENYSDLNAVYIFVKDREYKQVFKQKKSVNQDEFDQFKNEAMKIFELNLANLLTDLRGRDSFEQVGNDTVCQYCPYKLMCKKI
ncbi:MAG: PD-(D/E)XK nuclease family protein [bacterium]